MDKFIIMDVHDVTPKNLIFFFYFFALMYEKNPC
jgi:hypothetical protein